MVSEEGGGRREEGGGGHSNKKMWTRIMMGTRGRTKMTGRMVTGYGTGKEIACGAMIMWVLNASGYLFGRRAVDG